MIISVHESDKLNMYGSISVSVSMVMCVIVINVSVVSESISVNVTIIQSFWANESQHDCEY